MSEGDLRVTNEAFIPLSLYYLVSKWICYLAFRQDKQLNLLTLLNSVLYQKHLAYLTELAEKSLLCLSTFDSFCGFQNATVSELFL